MTPPSSKSDPTPKSVSVRAYGVGFGDAFLLSFEYAAKLDDGRRERHVLIDFGSARWPKVQPPTYAEIAEDIARRTDRQLDVVVVSHRHKDHLAGHGDPVAGQIIAELRPRLVVRPWTENPALAANARRPSGLGSSSMRFAANLREAQHFAADVSDALQGARGFRGSLAALAAQQVANKAAIDRLDQMASDAELGGRYLHADQPSGIEQVIPGVETKVLGPPLPEDWPEVTGQRANDPEYWISHRGLLDRMLVEAGRSEAPEGLDTADDEIAPGPARWLVERMRGQQTHSLLRIVRTLDDALNNTSVILLFRVGKRRLLFPGDAQIENWSYALRAEQAANLREDLDEVDLYKVGHHGSRNATPRSLVQLWGPRAGKLTSLLSTMPGVHGESEATAVPRATLIEALGELGPVGRTDELPPGSLYLELSGSTARRTPFSVEQGDRR